jgi:hypothetical protein
LAFAIVFTLHTIAARADEGEAGAKGSRFRPWQRAWQCNDIRVTVTSLKPFEVNYDIGGTIWGGSQFTMIAGDLYFNGRPRAMIRERVRAGLARAKSEGKRLGRPRIAPELEQRIRKALATPGRPGVRKIAERFGVDPGTVQRISRPRPFADGATSVVV